MKGMLNFLEKAGLVKLDEPVLPPVVGSDERPAAPAQSAAPQMPAPPAVPVSTSSKEQAVVHVLDFGQIYADARVPAARYPAERLLRVLEGLSAMDEATRIMTIKAIDEADESWTIADPIADSAHKARALSAYAQQIQAVLQKHAQETQVRLDALRQKKDESLSTIRKQIAELEALAAREQERNTRESSALAVSLNSAKERAALELAELAQMQQRLLRLANQFQAPADSLQS